MGSTVCILEVGYCAATRYHEKLTETQQEHATLTQILQQNGIVVHVLPVFLGNIGAMFHGTLADIKVTGAGAGRVARLASRSSHRVQKTIHSIVQSLRVADLTPEKRTARLDQRLLPRRHQSCGGPHQ